MTESVLPANTSQPDLTKAKLGGIPKLPLIVTVILSLSGIGFIIFAGAVLFGDVLKPPVTPTPTVTVSITTSPVAGVVDPECRVKVPINETKGYYMCQKDIITFAEMERFAECNPDLDKISEDLQQDHTKDTEIYTARFISPTNTEGVIKVLASFDVNCDFNLSLPDIEETESSAGGNIVTISEYKYKADGTRIAETQTFFDFANNKFQPLAADFDLAGSTETKIVFTNNRENKLLLYDIETAAFAGEETFTPPAETELLDFVVSETAAGIDVKITFKLKNKSTQEQTVHFDI